MDQNYPDLAIADSAETLSGLHAFAKLLGAYCNACAPRRKHWWHISLKPVVAGFTTGPLENNGQLFELVLDFHSLSIGLRIYGDDAYEFSVQGESAASMQEKLSAVLSQHSMKVELDQGKIEAARHEFDPKFASRLGQVYGQLALCLARFRSGISAETSPIQLWPHHFDLAMTWLPGEKVPGQDPEDEENADKQMNFGFTFGDASIPEPYFYVTAYPLPDALPKLSLPAGTTWHTEGFSGAVLLYRSLVQNADPNAYLLDLWNGLLSAGRNHMLANTTSGISQ